MLLYVYRVVYITMPLLVNSLSESLIGLGEVRRKSTMVREGTRVLDLSTYVLTVLTSVRRMVKKAFSRGRYPWNC